MWPLFTTAIFLGLVSSFHCVGMCGPLALSLPLSSLPAVARFKSLLAYHGGRLSVYGTLGAIFGVLGRHIYLAGLQQVFSIVLGVVILVLAVLSGWSSRTGRRLVARRTDIRPRGALAWISKVRQPLPQLIFRLWQSKGRYRYFVLGMANGLLPCGMVYLAIAGALSLSRIWESVVFMIVFGAGTLPALLLISSSSRLAGARTRAFMRSVLPGLVALMGALLILRGLGLGIPFLSPVLAHGHGAAVSCH
jgi:sulfite exporter TauE/SafE